MLCSVVFLVAPLVFYDFMLVLHKQTSSSLLRIYWTPATTEFGFKQTKTEPQSPRCTDVLVFLGWRWL